MKCRKCSSYRVFPMFGIAELPFFECIDCGAFYSRNLDDDVFQLRGHLHPLAEPIIVFPRPEIKKVLSGTKTQTLCYSDGYNVNHTYGVRTMIYEKSLAKIRILKKHSQQLGSMSREDIKKDGYLIMRQFRKAWMQLHGHWNPGEVIWVYDFELVEEKGG